MCELVHNTLQKSQFASIGISEPASGDDEVDDALDPLPCFKVGEDEGALAAHPLGVAVHDFEAGADQRREIDLVDDEEVGAGDAGAAFARDFVAGGDVDHVDRQIGEFGREGRGEVIAVRLDQH